MNRFVLTAFGLLIGAAAFAGMDNVVIAFSTQGPDKYADGAQVVDGECYALVWTPTGVTFAGIDSTGAAVAPSKVVLKAPVAKGGKCPDVLFEVDSDYAKANYPGGTWGVYLLDTRKFKTNAEGIILKGEVASCGLPGNPVNGYGEVGAKINCASGVASLGVTGSVSTGIPSATPEAGQNVKINKIDVDKDYVYLHVTGTLSSQIYGVQSGSKPGSLTPGEDLRYGQTGGEMIIVKPKTGDTGFFQVNRK